MRIFLDTEFTDFSTPRLISVGLASEDGREFYAELTDGWQPEHCTEFVIDVVLPLLGDQLAASMTHDAAGERLAQWLTGFGEPVTLIYDSETDWRLLSQLLWSWQEVVAVEAVLLGWSGFAMACRHEDLLEALLHDNPRRHHALVDARALRDTVLQTEAEFRDMSDHTIISLDNYWNDGAWWDAFLRRAEQRHRDPAFIAEALRSNQQRADILASVEIENGFALVEFGPHRVWAYVFSLEFYGSKETHAFLEMEDPANPTQNFDVFALAQTLWPNNVRHAKVLPLQPLHAKELLAEEYPGVAPLLTELDPVAAVRILDRALRSGLSPDDEVGLRRVVRDAIEQRQRIRRCFSYCLDLWDEALIRDDQS